MSDSTKKPSTGKTKGAGWEVGVRETVAASTDVVWRFLLGEGLPLWLGETTLPNEKGGTYRTVDGIVGEVRGYTENTKVRITWRPDDWPHDTTLQVAVKEAAGGTTIVIHHERLGDREERRMMLSHWKNVAAHLAAAFDPNR